MDWEKPGIAALTISICLTGSKFNFFPKFHGLHFFTGLAFFHLFFWICTQIRQFIYKFLTLTEETQTDCSVITDLRNEKAQPIYVLPFHFVR